MVFMISRSFRIQAASTTSFFFLRKEVLTVLADPRVKAGGHQCGLCRSGSSGDRSLADHFYHHVSDRILNSTHREMLVEEDEETVAARRT